MIPSVIHVDVSQIPKADLINLCRTTLEAVERFYRDPENVRRFEQWTREREGLQNDTPGT